MLPDPQIMPQAYKEEDQPYAHCLCLSSSEWYVEVPTKDLGRKSERVGKEDKMRRRGYT